MGEGLWYRRLGWVVWLNLVAVAVCGWLASRHVGNGIASAMVCVVVSLVYGWLGIAGVRHISALRVGSSCPGFVW